MSADNKSILNRLINEDGEILTDLESLESFISIGFKMLVEATKKSNVFPAGKSRDLYECYPSFHAAVQNQADYVLMMLSMMTTQINRKGYFLRKDDDSKFEMIVDSNDSLLENVGILLDELTEAGKNSESKLTNKNSEFITGSWNKNKNKKDADKLAAQVLNRILSQTKNIEKPQIKFKDKVNNDPNIPFEPRISYKYNMLKPLSWILETNEDGVSQFIHPYEFELEKFKPSQDQMVYKPPVLYRSLEETPLILVTEPEEVIKMVNNLENYKEIAVDLEHHSYRSFQGFTCLMQISTRDTDFVIDTLSLRSSLEILNKVFTNPSIVKVFHGADLDILWLQKDFSIYVVNMFDTHKAAKLLNFTKLSLGYLLSNFCNVNAQKQFQLADWRIRPLPEELLTYAREDTHYLLFIYDNLRNALIEKANNQTNLLESVISESTRVCLKRYLKPVFNNNGYLDLYQRSKKLFDNKQKFALQRLFEWRDTIARELDESYAYVLPDHMMLSISEVLPREAQGILACCNPVPAPVRQNLLALHQIILKAREQPLIKPVLDEHRFYKYTSSITSFDNPLQCPHDLNHEGEFRDDLPVLLGEKNDENSDKNDIFLKPWHCVKPIVRVFEIPLDASEKVNLLTVAKKTIHLTPYHQYKLSKKFLESAEVKTLRSNNEPHLKKEQESISLETIKREQNNALSVTGDQSVKGLNIFEYSVDDKKANSCNIIVHGSIKEKTLFCSKRQEMDDKIKLAKKLKKVSCAAVKAHASEETKAVPDSQKKRKKKKVSPNKKEFQPFDYSAVDFKKYQNLGISLREKIQKKKFKKEIEKKLKFQ